MNLNLQPLLNINVATVLTSWAIVCAFVSLVNRYIIAPRFPNVGRAVSAILSILPGHIGQLIADIKAILLDIASDNGSSDGDGGAGGTPTPVTPTSAVPPTSSRLGAAMCGATLIFGVQTGAFAITTEGCTPAVQAEAQTIEQLVLHDLSEGKTDEQIESDIASQLAGQPGVDAVIILNDVLQFLIDAKAIPSDLMANALAMRASVAPQAAAHRAAQ